MSLERSKLLISFSCVVGILSAVLGGPVGCAAAAVCAAVAIAVYYKNIAAITGISEDNPKVRTSRGAAIFTAVYLAAVLLLVVAINTGAFDGLAEKMSPRQLGVASKLLLAAILALPMAVYGNMAPKLPRSRFMGLRLPWTVRDEQTWIVAHRVLGYLSLPLTILLFVPVNTSMSLDTYAKFWWVPGLLLWVGIPALVSGVYYWKKFK